VAVAPSTQTESRELAALLYERHASVLRAFCFGRLRDRDEADEAVQATYVRALRALHKGVRPHSERAWLLTIARNVCASVATADRGREVQTDPVLLADSLGAAAERELPSEALAAALAALPEGQRAALLLREVHDLTYRQIAQELAVSTSVVESWIFRARRSVASSLRRARDFAFDLTGIATVMRSLASIGPAASAAAAVAIVSTAVVAHDPGPTPHAQVGRSQPPAVTRRQAVVADGPEAPWRRPKASMHPAVVARAIPQRAPLAPASTPADVPVARSAAPVADAPRTPAASPGPVPVAQPESVELAAVPAVPAISPPLLPDVPAVELPTLPVDVPALPGETPSLPSLPSLP